MPLEELLALYRYEAADSTVGGSSADSSSVELTDELPDMTLDKVSVYLFIFCFLSSFDIANVLLSCNRRKSLKICSLETMKKRNLLPMTSHHL